MMRGDITRQTERDSVPRKAAANWDGRKPIPLQARMWKCCESFWRLSFMLRVDDVQLSKPTNSLRIRGQSSISFEKRNPLLWPWIWFVGGANAIAISGAAGADPVRIIGNRCLARRAPANALIPNIICAFNRCRAGPLLCEGACIGPFLLFFYRR
jgi:hypothetical protein